jgi:hypothetical protein
VLARSETKISFDVQVEKTLYVLYPSGILNALTKIGGLLAILKISIIISFLHKRWFEKEINDQIAKNMICSDEEEAKSHVNVLNQYSIENFNMLMQRV